jgi:hypothetical protein
MATEHTCILVEDQAGSGTRADRPFVLAACFLLVHFIYQTIYSDVHR